MAFAPPAAPPVDWSGASSIEVHELPGVGTFYRGIAAGPVTESGGESVRIGDRRGALDFGDAHLPVFFRWDAPSLPVGTPTRVFGPGEHDAGQIVLRSGDHLRLERGAIVRGTVMAVDADDIVIDGPGVLDGSGHSRPTGYDGPRHLDLRGCRRAVIRDIVLVRPQTWQLSLFGCDDVLIEGVTILGDANSDDGIDIVGSRDVVVRDALIRTKDDCVAIKAIPGIHPQSGDDVARILVQDCTMWNGAWGNVLEIGYETSADRISDVIFRNIDVLRCEREGYGSGGVLTIHAGDRAVISNVLYEDIRVRGAREKLVDIKISRDRYSRDDERGVVRDVTFRRVRVIDGPPPLSLLQGYDGEHRVEDIRFEACEILGERLVDRFTARLIAEKTAEVRFFTEDDEKA